MIDDTNRKGWECGHRTRRYIEHLQDCLNKAEMENEHNSMLLASLKAQAEKAKSDAGVKARIPTSEEVHEDMISNLAHHLSQLSPEDRRRVIGMAEAWANGMAYADNRR